MGIIKEGNEYKSKIAQEYEFRKKKKKKSSKALREEPLETAVKERMI